VIFVVIQPEEVTLFGEMTAAVRDAVVRVHRNLVGSADPDGWPLVGDESNGREPGCCVSR
jgi:hypothetical protein